MTVLTLDSRIVVVEFTILFDDSAVLFGVLLCVADCFVWVDTRVVSGIKPVVDRYFGVAMADIEFDVELAVLWRVNVCAFDFGFGNVDLVCADNTDVVDVSAIV